VAGKPPNQLLLACDGSFKCWPQREPAKLPVSNDGGWKQLIRDMQDGMLDLEPPRKLFDHLSDEGVLLLNTSLTLAWIRKREDRSGVAGTFARASLCFTASSRSSLRDGRIMLCPCFGKACKPRL
jgi:hypothetical protein